jgi:hypothetical protein
LKHTVSTQILFGRINIRFGFVDCVDEYTVIIVHPGWNTIFFARRMVSTRIIAYDMHRINVHVILAHFFQYGRHSIKKELFIYRPYYIPYVLLFLDSFVEQ